MINEPLPLFIDRKNKQLLQLLSLAPIYKKQATVMARLVDTPEIVHTILSDGTKETENLAVVGDWIVTNPTGEHYVLKDNAFFARYEPSETPGVYLAKGFCRALVNPYGKKIKILAPWGGEQVGDWQCFFADSCDFTGACEGEPYIIDSNSFNVTYRKIG